MIKDLLAPPDLWRKQVAMIANNTLVTGALLQDFTAPSVRLVSKVERPILKLYRSQS
jgi:hypothetical protein